MEGDRQADLSVHGGPTKAIYIYPIQHYDFWQSKLNDKKLPWGSFGEIFTGDDVDEDNAFIRDEFIIIDSISSSIDRIYQYIVSHKNWGVIHV